MGRPIYTFGDSHAEYAWKEIPDVKFKSFGPRTMYKAGLDREIYVQGLPSEAIVCFCFGEVDCRCNVYKHQPWKEDIDEIVVHYLEMVSLNANILKNIWIFNVPPPPRRTGAKEVDQFPFLGTDEERLSYVRYMNEKLRQFPFLFVDIYDKYSDADGFLRMELTDGHVHIQDSTFLKEWVEAHR